MVVGYLYLKNILTWNKITRATSEEIRRIITKAKKDREKESRDIGEESRDKKEIDIRLVKERVDTLLDKISSDGIDSLSKEEQEFLKKASSFLQKHNSGLT